MANAKKLPITLTDREIALGYVYLVVDFLFLPLMLNTFNSILTHPLNAAWTNFLYFFFNFLFLCLIFQKYLKKSFIHAGKNTLRFLLYSILGFAVYQLCNFLLSYVIVRLYPAFANMNDASISHMLTDNFVIMSIGTIFFVPVAEELIHRGLIFTSMYRKSPAAAYIFSTIFFAAIHVIGYVGTADRMTLLFSLIQYIPAGLILAKAYEKSGCILVPMLIHASVNAMGIFALR